jgi:hypothetical protein
MKLICEVNEELKFITEANEKGEPQFYIEGTFMQGGIKNRNGRVYPVEILSREVNRYNKELVKENRAYGELGHPSGPTINLERVSHMIKELRQDGTHGDFYGKAKIMDTPYGNIVKNLMKEGAKLGVSSRGMGTLKRSGDHDEVQEDFHLATAADIVADPSAPNAFVRGIMENKEWIWDNGILRESEINDMRQSIVNAPKIDKDKAIIDAFSRFLTRL